MIPPNGDPRTFLGFDRDGGAWLLWWDLPGAPDVWSALGLDDRRYPAARVLTGKDAGLLHTLHVVASIPHATSRSTLAKRFRKLAKDEG